MTASLPDDLKQDGRYTMTKTAEILDIDQATLWRWRKSGRIRVSGYSKLNNRPFIKGKEIRRAFNAEY